VEANLPDGKNTRTARHLSLYPFPWILLPREENFPVLEKIFSSTGK
jgi:hypothetical protein